MSTDYRKILCALLGVSDGVEDDELCWLAGWFCAGGTIERGRAVLVAHHVRRLTCDRN